MVDFFKAIEKNFGFLLLVSAILAFIFPQYFLWGESFTDELLMFALFLGCLKINFSEIFHLKENFLKMLFFVALNILLLPLIFYFLSFTLDQEIRIGFFLLLAISGAVVTPLLASFLNLKILWSTVFVILTSAIIPFSLPFLTHFLFGISLEISVLEMTLFLAKIVFVPALLAILFRKFLPKITTSIFLFSGFVGSINMAIFLGIITAINQPFLSENLFQVSTVPLLLGLFLLFFLRFALGFYIPSSDQKEKWTNSLMFGNMNNGLVILLAAEFFAPKVLLIVLLSEIPWVLAQPVFQRLVQSFCKK